MVKRYRKIKKVSESSTSKSDKNVKKSTQLKSKVKKCRNQKKVTKNTICFQSKSKNRNFKIIDTKNVSVLDITDHKIPKKYQIITKENLLSALLFPLTIEEFKKDYYRKKALLIKSRNIDRLK